MQLIIEVPAEMDERVLEAFGEPDANSALLEGPWTPATKELVEERLQNYVRQTLYAFEDNKATLLRARERAAQTW